MKTLAKHLLFCTALAFSRHALSQSAESLTDKKIEQKFKSGGHEQR